ncbi:MAG: leucine--tRNA ligase [Candidatus Colwellbacteria bacterium]|nr:leucine--tRNA ligase [Candidatus Colwellbacteria bacterium]
MYPFSKIEKKWTRKWSKNRIYQPDLKKAERPFYNLMMFPYPSAEGLHVGNTYAFTGSDIYGRFMRMHGLDVFQPIGLDGFGIHSENYALKIGQHPMRLAKVTEKNFYRQLQSLGNGFDWESHLETYDPDYYKWTQWLFLWLYKHGLAYRKKQPVNWCPSCKTVLADEQVVNGECERCSTKVTKKELEQWFFRITKYAERLLKNLEKIDWSERIKVAQRNWIGKSEGALIRFNVKGQNSNVKSYIEVFTTRPDTLLGATYMVLAPEHELVTKLKSRIKNWGAVSKYVTSAKDKSEDERIKEGRVKTGVELKGVKAINPATRKEIPVWVSDYVLVSYGTGAIMAVPAYDDRDKEFAKKFKLPIVKSPLVSKDEIVKKVHGKKHVQYHLRDWLISRQRYWGPPIPMIYCDKCNWQPVREKDLPVKLPYIKNFRPTGKGESPLASVKSFYEVRCPKCKGKARRETDVSDTFLDSAWYFFRYISTQDKTCPWQPKKARKWLPVDMYIGGAEHSVLHLLYARFLTMVFKDTRLISHFEEPFTTFRAHGLLISEGAKMSKSKGNVVVPDLYVKKFGADTLRMYLMFLGPFQDGGDWRDSGIPGITRFLNRVWALQKRELRKSKSVSPWLPASIKKVTEDISGLRYNTAISELMIILNRLENEAQINSYDFKTFLLMLAPFAPFITEELWERLGYKKSIHLERWPEYKRGTSAEKTFELLFQVNGKLRGKTMVRTGIKESEAKEIALRDARVVAHVSGKRVRRVIFVPNRLINIVV